MVEVGHFILDPLWKRIICFPKEHSVVVVAECRQLKEVNEEPCRLVVVFHDECVEFCFSIYEGITWAKVDEELLNEQLVVFEPGWLIVWGVQEQLEVIEGRPFEEGHGVVDLGIFQLECFWSGPEIQFAFKQ